jgi:hypothetical protein
MTVAHANPCPAGSWLVAGWLATLPTALVLYAILMWLAPRLVAPPDLRLARQLFLTEMQREVKPEPLEQTRYELAVTLVPIVQLLFTAMIRTYLSSARRSTRTLRFCRLGAFGAQIVLAIFIAGMWIAQTFFVFPYFSLSWLAAVGAVVSALAAAACAFAPGPSDVPRMAARLEGMASPRGRRLLAMVTAVTMSIVVILPALFTSKDVALAVQTVNWHLPFTLDEYAAVLNGRSLQIDFFPQYQNVMPYAFIPVFHAIGLTITTFTATMCMLSLIALLCVYGAFGMITNHRGYALALYLAFLGISGYCVGRAPQVADVFNYYAWPMRLVLPSLVLWLTVRCLSTPTWAGMFGVFVVGSVAAVNNLDFGLPALIGSLAAMLTTAGRPFARPWLRSASQVVGLCAAAIVLVVGAAAALLVVRAGRLPDVEMILAFQRIFVRYGFFMLPMPTWGIHWVLFITFMAALVTGAAAVMGGVTLSSRAAPGVLIYAAVFGCGVSMYYVGRSHPYSLIIAFWPWALCVLLLTWETGYAATQQVGVDRRLLLLPGALLFLHGGLFLSNLAQLPSPRGQIDRILQSTDFWTTMEDEIVVMIRTHTKPGEKVGVVFPYGHLFALRADVDNVFPFANQKSMILHDQVRLALQAFAANHVSTVFGYFTGEFRTALEELGFRMAGGVVVRYPEIPNRFEMWVKRKF